MRCGIVLNRLCSRFPSAKAVFQKWTFPFKELTGFEKVKRALLYFWLDVFLAEKDTEMDAEYRRILWIMPLCRLNPLVCLANNRECFLRNRLEQQNAIYGAQRMQKVYSVFCDAIEQARARTRGKSEIPARQDMVKALERFVSSVCARDIHRNGAAFTEIKRNDPRKMEPGAKATSAISRDPSTKRRLHFPRERSGVGNFCRNECPRREAPPEWRDKRMGPCPRRTRVTRHCSSAVAQPRP